MLAIQLQKWILSSTYILNDCSCASCITKKYTTPIWRLCSHLRDTMFVLFFISFERKILLWSNAMRSWNEPHLDLVRCNFWADLIIIWFFFLLSVLLQLVGRTMIIFSFSSKNKSHNSKYLPITSKICSNFHNLRSLCCM